MFKVTWALAWPSRSWTTFTDCPASKRREAWVCRSSFRGARPRLIAGLIPEPLGPMPDKHRQALGERKALIEGRASNLARGAVTSGASWTRGLGTAPHDPRGHAQWLDALTTIAAYRDRYAVTSDRPLGIGATTDAQRADRALQALHRAQTSLAGAGAVASRSRGHVLAP